MTFLSGSHVENEDRFASSASTLMPFMREMRQRRDVASCRVDADADDAGRWRARRSTIVGRK